MTLNVQFTDTQFYVIYMHPCSITFVFEKWEMQTIRLDFPPNNIGFARGMRSNTIHNTSWKHVNSCPLTSCQLCSLTRLAPVSRTMWITRRGSRFISWLHVCQSNPPRWYQGVSHEQLEWLESVSLHLIRFTFVDDCLIN